LGGQVVKRQEVTRLVETEGRIGWAETKDGQKWYANNFISNLHPAQTLAITESSRIKPAFRNRVNGLENAVSAFLVNIVFKKNSFKYFDSNYYYHNEGQLWNLAEHTEENWPLGFCIFVPVSREENGYAESMTLLAYMRFDEVEEWKDSFNTTSSVNERGEGYEAFKKRKAEKLIDEAEKKMPGIRAAMKSYYTGTPLTIRDYLGGWDGSLYGIMRDYHHPMQTTFSPKTSLPNLFLTGQNLNLHGILGTSMSAIQTSAVVMGSEEIIDKIRNA
jgi:all-trans-retinol 13,14-reductase